MFYFAEYMREQIVVLLSAVFISFFVQIALEVRKMVGQLWKGFYSLGISLILF